MTAPLLGFTATTARGDGKGLDTVFERIVYSRTLPDLCLQATPAIYCGVNVALSVNVPSPLSTK